MTLSEYLNQIKERCDAATEGPWKFEPRNCRYYNGDEVRKDISLDEFKPDNDPNYDLLGAEVEGPPYTGRSTFQCKDAWFIAHARQDVEVLLNLVRELNNQKSFLERHLYSAEAALLPEGMVLSEKYKELLKEDLERLIPGDHFTIEEGIEALAEWEAENEKD